MRRQLATQRGAGVPLGTQTLDFTGGVQTFTVPAGVTAVTVECLGAGSAVAKGGRAVGTFTVTPGQVLQVYCGGVGPATGTIGGFNGGGSRTGTTGTAGSVGHGATDVRTVAGNLSTRLIVAGGGGGIGYNTGGGGHGGAATGGTGALGFASDSGGYGGTQTTGGQYGFGSALNNGNAGVLGLGGTGGGGGTTYGRGGGGGGGWYGGGGGGSGGNAGAPQPGGSGGGGSNGPTAALTTDTQGYWDGPGRVIITWNQ